MTQAPTAIATCVQKTGDTSAVSEIASLAVQIGDVMPLMITLLPNDLGQTRRGEREIAMTALELRGA